MLVIGAGDSVELALRWLLMNPDLHLRPVGLLDDDQFKHGRQIHGVQVLGSIRQLAYFLHLFEVQGVILGNMDISLEIVEQVQKTCLEHDCWVRRLRLDLEEI